MASAAFVSAQQQQCSNYGALSGSACDCPSGLGGPDCTQLACGNALINPPSSRPLWTGTGTQGCGSQCTAGWTGPTCNVPQNVGACTAALGSSGVTDARFNDIVLNTGAYVFTEGYTSCNVVNPTLQSVFSGTTTLTFQNTMRPDLSVYPSTSGNATMNAQLWYSAASGNTTLTEQFFCAGSGCSQTNSTSTSGTTVDWQCPELRCTCIPGTAFCGGGALDISGTINGLAGPISVSCDAAGQSCSFKQSVLQTLFGQNGLALSSCTHGECVRQTAIAEVTSTASASTQSGGGGLSGGVIAGLSVLGAIILLCLALVLLGWLGQRRARRGRSSAITEKVGGPIAVRWHRLGYVLPAHRKAFIGKKNDGRVLLDELSGEVDGGLCAILGPTGAGKSTFVDILAGKRKSGEQSGTVQFLDPSGVDTQKISLGFVDQHDVLPATSTVREAMMFAAELKMPETVSKEAKAERVFEILQQLGLQDVADSRIGNTERRGISGGERRRLSIGLELLAAPAVLICDEPTSGLDSTSAMRVVQVLKNLTSSSHGRPTTVITTIHAPSSQAYHMFDQVILLGRGGHLLYNGPLDNVKAHFAARGRPVPADWNPADHLLDIASETVLSPHEPSTSSKAGSEEHAVHKLSPASESSSLKIDRRSPATMFTQFEVLAQREMLNLKRDWTSATMHIVVSALVGLFVGGIYYQVDTTIGGFQSRVGSLFFLGSLLAFSSLSALSNFATVKLLYLRERSNALYAPLPWLASRVLFDIIPLRVIPTIIVSCIVYWMVGLTPAAAQFFKFLLMLVLFNIATVLWNLLLAANVEAGIAILISAVLNLFQMAYAGFFVNLGSIPAVLRWLQWIAPLKYCLEALTVNEVSSGLMINDSLQGVQVSVSAALIMDILFGFKSNAYYRDILVMMAFIIGFALLLTATVVLRLKEVR
ncbi:hypothetical protein OIV83_000820 [Microbotryomycetes sp. JL201]|nr:hypothetical protein OIV83_000820 [Microbotryomycetes sp. JL201]